MIVITNAEHLRQYKIIFLIAYETLDLALNTNFFREVKKVSPNLNELHGEVLR